MSDSAMRWLRSYRLWARWLLLVPLLVSLACATLVGGPLPSPDGPTAAFTAENPTPADSSPTQAGNPADTQVILGPGPIVLTDTTASLAGLSSYTANLRVAFDGTEAGQPRQWSKTTVMVAAQQPPARQVTIAWTGEDHAPALLLEVLGTAYTRRGDEPCTAAASVPGDGLAERFEPAALLSPLAGADEAGTDTVNGVDVYHYTFDERALVRAGFSKSVGEAWVAIDGGYVVRYQLTTEAGPEYFGADTAGTLTLSYELTGINQPVAIEVPLDCPAGLLDVPLLPDAVNVRSLPGVLTYDSAAPVAEAGAFYQTQLTALGWELSNTSMITDTAALLDFSGAQGSLTVIVKPAQDHTSIRIVHLR